MLRERQNDQMRNVQSTPVRQSAEAAQIADRVTELVRAHTAELEALSEECEARPALLGSWDTSQGPSQTRMSYAAC